MGPIRRRALAAAGAVLAGAAGCGPGTAAEPSQDPGAEERSTNTYARSRLTGPGGLVAMANVMSLDGATPAADLEIYASGYTCVPSNPVAVTLDPPESATAEGDVDLVCTPDNSHEDEHPDGGPRLTGSATVDLTWTGVGEERYEVGTDLPDCVAEIHERQAQLTGEIEVDVAGLYTGSTTDNRPHTDTALRSETTTCPAPLG